MKLKTKYQYSYFIYPYIINEKNYDKYIYHLLKKKNCKLKFFDKKADTEIYSYFSPEIQEFLFWSIDLNNESKKEFEKMDLKMRSRVLAKYPCNIFEYQLEKAIQGKVIEKDGIFFNVEKIELICFKTGINFLLLKTIIAEESDFSDVLNFNYKFQSICSDLADSKEYANIKIQTDNFKDTKEIYSLLKELTGSNNIAKNMNIDTQKFYTYSYTCLDQSCWNEQTGEDVINKEFAKYKAIKRAEEVLEDKVQEKNELNEKYIKYGFSNKAVVLLTTDYNVYNYTKLLYLYEKCYLYHYIVVLYKKLYLSKMSYELNNKRNFIDVKEKFIDFTKKMWIVQISTTDMGIYLEKNFTANGEIEKIFFKLKNKYDILYKEHGIQKTSKKSKAVAIIVGITILLCLINLFFMLSN